MDPTAPDPRVERSRTRLLDAAEALLRAGGLGAVTVEAVTRRSAVARTTLYRHFHDLDRLHAATLERMLPTPPRPPADGTVRERLVELLTQYATTLRESPTYLTTLAWLADDGEHDRAARDSLRRNFLRHCVEPFDELLARPDTPERADAEAAVVVSRLLGPIVFVALVGIGSTDRATCCRYVDDFLATGLPRPAAPT